MPFTCNKAFIDFCFSSRDLNCGSSYLRHMSLHRKIYWTDGNTINMANMDGSNSKVLHQNQRDPAGSLPFFPTASQVWRSQCSVFFSGVSCWKSHLFLCVLVAVKVQHVLTASTRVASNTQGRGADVINAQQHLSFRLEASDWLSRQGSAWTLTNTYSTPESTDAFQSFPQMSWFPENVFELMLTETLQCPQLETGLFPRVLFACRLSVRGDGLL